MEKELEALMQAALGKVFVPLEASGRHVHITAGQAQILFGHNLTPDRPLSQPGQFLSKERVTVKGPKGEFQNVAVLGPERPEAQVEISLTDGRVIETGDPLYVFEDLLNLEDGFYKCSRSYIVNIHRIDTYTLKEVKMRSGYRIPISRKNQKEFENTYFSVTFGKAGDMS